MLKNYRDLMLISIWMLRVMMVVMVFVDWRIAVSLGFGGILGMVYSTSYALAKDNGELDTDA